jgi:hypothetical protein
MHDSSPAQASSGRHSAREKAVTRTKSDRGEPSSDRTDLAAGEANEPLEPALLNGSLFSLKNLDPIGNRHDMRLSFLQGCRFEQGRFFFK